MCLENDGLILNVGTMGGLISKFDFRYGVNSAIY